MDLDLAAIDAVLDAFRTVALAKIAERRHQRNTLSPISKLPTEIMSNVLVECLPTRSASQHSRLLRIITLSSVCSTWRGIIGGTPRFWTVLDTRTAPSLALITLKNSGAALISLTGPIKAETHTNESFLAACHHTYRWSSVNVTAPRSQDFKILECASVPNLKTLVLTCRTPPRPRRRFDHEPVHLFREDTPLLKSVSITGVAVKWSCSMWRNLHSLELAKVEGPDAKRFLNILESCAGLRSLVLRKFALPSSQVLVAAERSPISLLFLEQLTLQSLPLDLVTLCLSLFQCPALTSFYVVTPKTRPSDNLPDLEPIVTFARSFLDRITSNRLSIEVKAADDTFAVLPTDAWPTAFGLRGLDAVVERVCRSFTTMQMAAWIDDSGSPDAWGMMNTFPGCTIIKTEADSTRLFRYLGTPISADNGVKTWPFPHLHTMFLCDFCTHPECLLEMVQSRSGCGLGPKDETIVLPTALKRLVLVKGCSLDWEMVVKIEMILGGGTVVQEDEPGFGPWDIEEEQYSDSDSDFD